MEYKDPTQDFIERTLNIIRQYDTYVMPKIQEVEQHEVTLLINCLLGLIALPVLATMHIRVWKNCLY